MAFVSLSLQVVSGDLSRDCILPGKPFVIIFRLWQKRAMESVHEETLHVQFTPEKKINIHRARRWIRNRGKTTSVRFFADLTQAKKVMGRNVRFLVDKLSLLLSMNIQRLRARPRRGETAFAAFKAVVKDYAKSGSTASVSSPGSGKVSLLS